MVEVGDVGVGGGGLGGAANMRDKISGTDTNERAASIEHLDVRVALVISDSTSIAGESERSCASELLA